jgi:hypothetical protein
VNLRDALEGRIFMIRQSEASFCWRVYSVALFPVVLVLGACYYVLALPVMLLVGAYITLCGVLEKVDWYSYDTDIIRHCDSSILRFIWSFWTNRREPMPAGGKKDLWKDRSELYRYIRWHIRNPLSDLGMYYVGFAGRGGYRKLEVLKKSWLEINLKKLEHCPFYFPRYTVRAKGFRFSLGWKKRGCFGMHLKR